MEDKTHRIIHSYPQSLAPALLLPQAPRFSAHRTLTATLAEASNCTPATGGFLVYFVHTREILAYLPILKPEIWLISERHQQNY